MNAIPAWRRATLLVVPLLLATACSSGLRSSAPAEQIYVLHPEVARGTSPVVNAVLIVPRPEVQPALATHRIALTQPGNRLDYFADSRWGASLPLILGALSVESLLASNLFAVVASGDRSAGSGDFQLLLTVRHFEAEYAGDAVAAAPTARVAIECLLTTGAPRRVVGRCDSEVMEPARENRMGDIVAALDRASQRALAEIGGKAAALAAGVPQKK
jgi:ABC-type uncharacterized transport system auxiliary subunit